MELWQLARIMGIGQNGEAGNFLGDCAILIALEAYRLSEGARLPFATAPAPGRGTETAAMRPGIDMLREAQDVVLQEIKGQVARLDDEAMQAATATRERAA